MAQEQTPTFSVRGEWAFALEIAKVFVLGAVVIVGIWRGGDALSLIDGYIRARIADKQLSGNLAIGYSRLDTQTRDSIQQLVKFADPFTEFTATDLDDKVVAWLQEIANEATGQPQG